MANDHEHPETRPEANLSTTTDQAQSLPEGQVVPAGTARPPGTTTYDESGLVPESRIAPVEAAESRETSSGISVGTVLLSGLLGLVAGGAGAWAYHAFLHDRAPDRTDETAAVAPKEAAMDVELASRVNDLADRVDQVETRVASIKEPEPPVDLKPLQQRVARLEGISDRVDTLSGTVDPLAAKADENAQRLAELTKQVDNVDSELTTLQDQVLTNEKALTASTRPASVRTESRPSTTQPGQGEDDNSTSASSSSSSSDSAAAPATLERGITLFKQKQYEGARDVLEDAIASGSDDARAYYFAALANGFATRQWRGETEKLVEQGMAREQAGTPDRDVIDASLADLTKNMGSEWIAAYRRRIRR